MSYAGIFDVINTSKYAQLDCLTLDEIVDDGMNGRELCCRRNAFEVRRKRLDA